MTGHAPARPAFWSRWRMLALALCAIVVTAFLGANAHLIYVSVSTQPACVPHMKSPQEGAATYRAAKSSC